MSRDERLCDSWARSASEGSVFAIGGSVQLDEAQPMQLVVKCNTQSTAEPAAEPSPSASSAASSSSSSSLPQPTLVWQLPLPAGQRAEDTHQLMQAVLAQCRAATFGRGGEAVLDTAYRFAYHLPPSRFVTSFHPAQPGCSVLADIARMVDPAKPSLLSRSIHAELYNLNVYTAGGHFKAHVDTPRADNMFGSLVVCLPVPHQGGQLTVRHGGEQRVFDWSLAEGSEGSDDSKREQLQWAAFFGNCEHEVAAVTSGYRCTLTYNLYRENARPTASFAASHSAEPLSRGDLPRRQPNYEDALPLVRELGEALADAQWMADGGVLGIKCAHAYGHTSRGNRGTRVRPAMLKGLDALVYSQLAESLRLSVKVRLVAENEDEDGGNKQCYVSDVMQPVVNSGHVDQEGESTTVPDVLPHFEPLHRPVVWLNGCDASRETSAAYATYGNEPGSDTAYTEVALLVHIPRYEAARAEAGEDTQAGRRVRARLDDDAAAAAVH